MKIVQTLWSKPGLNANWLDTRFHYLSWALSCLQLRKYYDNVELYTDELGKYLLIDCFKLPYTKVHITLEEVPYPTYLWAVPKILTYSLQTGPFLHIDGDAFLFKKIPEDFVYAHDFIFQNEEIDSSQKDGFYFKMFTDLFTIKPQEALPEWIRAIDMKEIRAFNAGILGGSNMAFFKEYTAAAFAFLAEEKTTIEQFKQPQFATHMSEQVLPAYMKKDPRFKSAVLFEPDHLPGFYIPAAETIFDEAHFPQTPLSYDYTRLDEFGISPYGRKYIHLTGTKKRSLLVCKQIAKRLLNDYPEYYQRIIDFFDHTKTPVIPHPPAYLSKRGDIKNNSSSFAEKRSQLKPENIFRRTVKVCEFFNNEKAPAFPDATSLQHWVQVQTALVSEPTHQLKIKDIFTYESLRYEFSAHLTNQQLEEIEERCKYSNDLIHDPLQVSDDQLILRTHPYSKVIHSRWNWWDGYIYLERDIEEEAINMLIYPDKTTYSIAELRISDNNVKLLQFFADGNTMFKAFKAMLPFMNLHKNHEELQLEFFKDVVYLMSNGVLFADLPDLSRPILQPIMAEVSGSPEPV
ncbi:DUF6734 family protein [Chitinophaga nivalis]|uniref:DUF6734 domain-containing protein n=1 Tax=Chitinophaga nivalis TaxID=2991709 RepID=A0ABT3IPT9_9BACT|nr:DUF6734 family protein [Chitinophaga nivalis]MCW3464494.1 hypothetical protein [Chitinophaga nivalis]MCW3485815.1 hypothetical protein [Chitinophaga nivalis]